MLFSKAQTDEFYKLLPSSKITLLNIYRSRFVSIHTSPCELNTLRAASIIFNMSSNGYAISEPYRDIISNYLDHINLTCNQFIILLLIYIVKFDDKDDHPATLQKDIERLCDRELIVKEKNNKFICTQNGATLIDDYKPNLNNKPSTNLNDLQSINEVILELQNRINKIPHYVHTDQIYAYFKNNLTNEYENLPKTIFVKLEDILNILNKA
jgi:hypothetical protein